jgi:hypothetical protein
MTFEHTDCRIDLTLLQAELCQSCNCRFTLWIGAQCLIATSLRRLRILLPLKHG